MFDTAARHARVQHRQCGPQPPIPVRPHGFESALHVLGCHVNASVIRCRWIWITISCGLYPLTKTVVARTVPHEIRPVNVSKTPGRHRGGDERCVDTVARNNAARSCGRDDPTNELRRSARVERNDGNAAQHRAPERGEPFRATVAPDDESVSRLEVGSLDSSCEGLRRRSQLIGGVRPLSQPAIVAQRSPATVNVAVEDVEQVLRRLPLHADARLEPGDLA